MEQIRHKSFQNCIAAYSACAIECNYCASANLDLKEVENKLLSHCTRLLHDCAAVCVLAMETMAGGTEFVRQISQLCHEICQACADECEKYSYMEHCKRCAEVCRRCAMECCNLSKM